MSSFIGTPPGESISQEALAAFRDNYIRMVGEFCHYLKELQSEEPRLPGTINGMDYRQFALLYVLDAIHDLESGHPGPFDDEVLRAHMIVAARQVLPDLDERLENYRASRRNLNDCIGPIH